MTQDTELRVLSDAELQHLQRRVGHRDVPTFPDPRCDEARQHNALVERWVDAVDRERELRDKIDGLRAEREELSGKLIDLERRRARDEQVAGEITKTEKALQRVNGRLGEPWGERLSAAAAVVQEARRDIDDHDREHADALIAEKVERARERADRLNDLSARWWEAYLDVQREAEDTTRFMALWQGFTGRDLESDRSGVAASAIRELVETGGQAPRVPTRDPRVPIHGPAADDVPASTEERVQVEVSF